MTEGFHPPIEEYLSAIHDLEEDNVEVIQARLAERLGHAAPTVHEMVKRLRQLNYVEVDYRTIRLTEEGLRQARSVVRKHRLAERLLTDVIGLAWHKAHLEAARWEHVISDEVADHLQVILHNPSTCPHGNPIPGAVQDDRLLVPLISLSEGTAFVLSRVPEQVEFDESLLTFLGESGFVTGTRATIRAIAENAITVDFNNRSIDLAEPLPSLLLVQVAA